MTIVITPLLLPHSVIHVAFLMLTVERGAAGKWLLLGQKLLGLRNNYRLVLRLISVIFITEQFFIGSFITVRKRDGVLILRRGCPSKWLTVVLIIVVIVVETASKTWYDLLLHSAFVVLLKHCPSHLIVIISIIILLEWLQMVAILVEWLGFLCFLGGHLAEVTPIINMAWLMIRRRGWLLVDDLAFVLLVIGVLIGSLHIHGSWGNGSKFLDVGMVASDPLPVVLDQVHFNWLLV